MMGVWGRNKANSEIKSQLHKQQIIGKGVYAFDNGKRKVPQTEIYKTK